MNQLPDFETAQRRIAERQRRQNILIIWGVIFAVLVVINIVGGGPVNGYLCPIAIFVGLFAAYRGVTLYFESPARELTSTKVEQELLWLYGEDWQRYSGGPEYAFAQERIRQRRAARWKFLLHCLLYLVINGPLSFMAFGSFHYFYEPSLGIFFFILPVMWGLVLLANVRSAFPTAGMLSRREHAAAEAIEREMHPFQSIKRKNDEKAKRDTRIVLSADGEMIEIPIEPDSAEKTKPNYQ